MAIASAGRSLRKLPAGYSLKLQLPCSRVLLVQSVWCSVVYLGNHPNMWINHFLAVILIILILFSKRPSSLLLPGVGGSQPYLIIDRLGGMGPISSRRTGSGERWKTLFRKSGPTTQESSTNVLILLKIGFRKMSTCWIQDSGPEFFCFAGWVTVRTCQLVKGHTVWILLVTILTYKEVTMLEKGKTIIFSPREK